MGTGSSFVDSPAPALLHHHREEDADRNREGSNLPGHTLGVGELAQQRPRKAHKSRVSELILPGKGPNAEAGVFLKKSRGRQVIWLVSLSQPKNFGFRGSPSEHNMVWGPYNFADEILLYSPPPK